MAAPLDQLINNFVIFVQGGEQHRFRESYRGRERGVKDETGLYFGTVTCHLL